MIIQRKVACGLSVVLVAVSLAAHAFADDVDISPYVDLLREPDKEFRALALDEIRTKLPGEAWTKAFAELLPKLPPETQVELLSALADRKDQAAAAEVRKLLASAMDQSVRVAAIKALGRLGGASDLPVMVSALSAPTEQERAAARLSLVMLPGEESSTAMVEQMDDATAAEQIALIEILTTRRARNAIPAILDLAVSDDDSVRRAAMTSLGQIGEPEHVPGMVQGILKAERGRERDTAEKMVMLVCHRIDDKDKQAAPLLAAMDDLNEEKRTALLFALGRVGGPQAREVIEAVIDDDDHEMHAIGVKALCNWPHASIAPRLLEIARTEEDPGLARGALRALIRVAPLPDDRTDQRRLDVLRTAMVMCQEDDDRRLALDRAKAIRTIDTLRFVVPHVDDASFSEQACLTVVELAHHSGLREAHEEEFHRALDQVIATSDDAVVRDRAQRYKEDKTWVRPK